MRFVQVALFVGSFGGLSFVLHRTLWGWLGRVAPRWIARHRTGALLALAALFLSPLVRALALVTPLGGATAWLGAAAMLWHVGVGLAMAPIAAVRLGVHAWSALARARGAKAPLAADPPGDPDPPAGDPPGDDPPGDPPPAITRRQALEAAAGGALVATSGAMLGWGTLRGRLDWQLREVPIPIARLPKALDGFTIVQISDVHVGAFVTERELARGLELVRRARGDLIAITGDLIDHDRAYVPLAARVLGALSAREGVACIPGNHDYYTGVDRVLDAMQRAGLHVLMNRARRVGGAGSRLWIAGVDDLHGATARVRGGPDLEPVLRGVPDDDAVVLLAHQPPYVETARGRVDLQLSGHTHGGQINPGFSPAALVLRYVEGLYAPDERTRLYVNRGFGTAGPPTRVGAPPEITKLVLVAT